jgi:tRNA-binding EMAP/Myf-like protein
MNQDNHHNHENHDGLHNHDNLDNKASEPYIVFDDFLKVQMKAGKVLTAEIIEKSEKLLKLTVDFGETDPRQVISGIRNAFPEPAVHMHL